MFNDIVSSFSAKFASPGELRDYLLLPDPLSKAQSELRLLRESQTESAETISRLKRRIRREKATIKTAADQLTNAAFTSEAEIVSLTNEISRLQIQIRAAEESSRLSELSNAEALRVWQAKNGLLDERIAQLRAENASQKRRIAELQLLNKTSPDAPSKLSAKNDQINETNRKMAELNAKNGALNRQLESAHASIRQLENRLSQHDGIVEGLNGQIADARRENQVVKSENADLETRNKSMVAQLEAGRISFRQSQSAFRALELDLENVRRANRRLLESFDDLNARFSERLAAETNAARSQSEHSISVLKKANRELREICANAKKGIEQTEQRNCELLERIAALESDNGQYKSQQKADGEAVARERQLSAARSKALALQTETECQNRIEQLKSAHEANKRNLLASVIGSFQAYFDGSRELNDDSLESVVNGAKRELDRLKSSDEAVRRLLGLGPEDAAEAAIVALLRELYR
jgi:chromosome segregation ATPase